MAVFLEVELVPKNLWGKNLRSELPKKEWDFLRKRSYARANYLCEVCGGKGRKHPVECHEVWSYNDKTKVQKLEGLVALCPPCHRVKHLGRTMGTPYKYSTLNHMKKVNDLDDYYLEMYLNIVFGTWSERSKYDWSQDLSELPAIKKELEAIEL